MDKVWREALLDTLSQTGDLGNETAEYIRAQCVRMRFRKHSKSTGARWFAFANISLNSRYYSTATNLTSTKLLSLLVHEVHHLKQGMWTALSVYGELDAWQVEYRFYKSIKPSRLDPALEELLLLPLSFERENLRRAASLMQTYAGKGYRINWLPLYPIQREIRYWFSRRELS